MGEEKGSAMRPVFCLTAGQPPFSLFLLYTNYLEASMAVILSKEKMAELSVGSSRVYALMKDGKYHYPDEIRCAASSGGMPALEGMRRLRELRRVPGLMVIKKHMGGRVWAYRLKKEENTNG